MTETRAAAFPPLTTTEQYREAVEDLTLAAADYYSGQDSPFTDREYDDALDAVQQFEEQHPEDAIEHGLFTRVAAGTATTGDVPHPVPMLSLEKVKTDEDIRKFLTRVAEAAPDVKSSFVSVQPKLDGLAIRAVYRAGNLVQVVTRGDGQAGEDVTARIARDHVTIHGLPDNLENESGHLFPVDAEVRGELVMSTADFAASNANRIAAGKAGFANPRNAAAGSLRAETLDYEVEMTFVTYEHDGAIAEDPSFIYADQLPGSHIEMALYYENVIEAVTAFGEMRADYDYPTDGAVIKAVEGRVRSTLGTGTRAPKWAVAYKYEAQTGETIIRDIVVEVGRTGNLSFTAVFDPVLVDGSTISRASLHNTSLIAEKDIRIGSKAVVAKMGDIIPQVISVTNDETTEPWTPPAEDADGFPYVYRGKFLVSTNPDVSIAAQLTYAASRDVLDIDGLGREVAEALIEGGLVFNLTDLFKVDEAALADMPFGSTVYGSVRAQKLAAKIADARTRPLARFITALGIRMTGRTMGRRLASHLGSLSGLMQATTSDLATVDGIGPERARVIADGIQRNLADIHGLVDLGIDPREETTTSGRPLDGMSVVISGGLTGSLAGLNRSQGQELIESLGGKASSSVSKTTSLLVTNETTTSKAVKAAQLGVRIVTPEQFANMIGR